MRTKRERKQHSDPFYPIQDWSEIREGAEVEVQYPMGGSYKAKVDVKSPDSAIVWVIDSNGQGRKMYGRWEGVGLFTVTEAGAEG